MKILEAEGLVTGEPRQGFQVVRIPDKKKAPLLAYLFNQGHPGKLDGFSTMMMSVFQKVAGRHGFLLMSLGIETSTTNAIRDSIQHICKVGVAGVILDGADASWVEAVEKLGLPTVNAQFWNNRFDSIGQNNFGGALLAAEHLVQRGHKRIAWIGPSVETIQSEERWVGVVAGLRRHQQEITSTLLIDDVDGRDSDAYQVLFRQPNRPTGFVCLWAGMAIGVARTAARLNLRMGRDFDLVGWATEEQFNDYKNTFPEGQAPATVTWSIECLAENVISRLAERWAKPNLPVVRTVVEAQLRFEPLASKAVRPVAGQ